eukprot:6189161-Pleurochrysis_carterae.AAC.6
MHAHASTHARAILRMALRAPASTSWGYGMQYCTVRPLACAPAAMPASQSSASVKFVCSASTPSYSMFIQSCSSGEEKKGKRKEGKWRGGAGGDFPGGNESQLSAGVTRSISAGISETWSTRADHPGNGEGGNQE